MSKRPDISTFTFTHNQKAMAAQAADIFTDTDHWTTGWLFPTTVLP